MRAIRMQAGRNFQALSRLRKHSLRVHARVSTPRASISRNLRATCVHAWLYIASLISEKGKVYFPSFCLLCQLY